MKKLLLAPAVAFVVILLAFARPAPSSDKMPAWLPPDFDAKNGVLLITKIEWPERQQRKIEEFMKETYPYKYEFIGEEDFSDTATRFSDKSTYRFILSSNVNNHIMHQFDPTVPNSSRINVMMFDFFFIDRISKKKYPGSGKGASWASMPLKYMIREILKQTK